MPIDLQAAALRALQQVAARNFVASNVLVAAAQRADANDRLHVSFEYSQHPYFPILSVKHSRAQAVKQTSTDGQL